MCNRLAFGIVLILAACGTDDTPANDSAKNLRGIVAPTEGLPPQELIDRLIVLSTTHHFKPLGLSGFAISDYDNLLLCLNSQDPNAQVAASAAIASISAAEINDDGINEEMANLRVLKLMNILEGKRANPQATSFLSLAIGKYLTKVNEVAEIKSNGMQLLSALIDSSDHWVIARAAVALSYNRQLNEKEIDRVKAIIVEVRGNPGKSYLLNMSLGQ